MAWTNKSTTQASAAQLQSGFWLVHLDVCDDWRFAGDRTLYRNTRKWGITELAKRLGPSRAALLDLARSRAAADHIPTNRTKQKTCPSPQFRDVKGVTTTSRYVARVCYLASQKFSSYRSAPRIFACLWQKQHIIFVGGTLSSTRASCRLQPTERPFHEYGPIIITP